MRGKHVPFYWGGAMVGRFIGAYLLRVFSPGKVLACAAGGVMVLLLISANSTGAVVRLGAAAVGLFNSIMFPTIFSLACEGPGTASRRGLWDHLHGHRGRGGGAADHRAASRTGPGLQFALTVPGVCYAGNLELRDLRAPALRPRRVADAGALMSRRCAVAAALLMTLWPAARSAPAASGADYPAPPEALFKDFSSPFRRSPLRRRQGVRRCRPEGCAGGDSRAVPRAAAGIPGGAARASSRHTSRCRARWSRSPPPRAGADRRAHRPACGTS